MNTVSLFVLITAATVGARIVNVIRSSGEPIDNRYIEPNSGFGYRSVSVPGCPKSIEGIPWLYYGNPARCFLAGTQGPCLSGQYFSATPGTPYGICVGIPQRSGESVPFSGSTSLIENERPSCSQDAFNRYINQCVGQLTFEP